VARSRQLVSPPPTIRSARCASRARRNCAATSPLPLDWGGYALWHGAPALKVSLDAASPPSNPPTVVEDGFAFFRADGGDGASHLVEAYPTTLVLVPRGIPTPIDGRAEWEAAVQRRRRRAVRAGGDSNDQRIDAPRGVLPFP
jgi:hypothetical protein